MTSVSLAFCIPSAVASMIVNSFSSIVFSILELDIEHEKALEQARTNFFSAVSHELKTPITIIKGQLEGMLLGIGPYKDHGVYFMSTKKLLTLALGSALLVGAVAGCSSSVNIPSDNNTTKNVSYQAQTVSDTENAANDSTTAELPGGSVDYSIYEPYGLSYDQENYYFTYNGNVVRFFNDPIAGASFTNFFSGTVDIEADRDEENNLVGIKECSKENYDRHTQKHNNFNPTDTSLSTVQKGESTPQLWLKDYADYGITYNEQSGGWYYNNQRILISIQTDAYPYGAYCDVSLDAENKDDMVDFNIGDEVIVYYDGNIAESYPLQINTVYAISLKDPAN